MKLQWNTYHFISVRTDWFNRSYLAGIEPDTEQPSAAQYLRRSFNSLFHDFHRCETLPLNYNGVNISAAEEAIEKHGGIHTVMTKLIPDVDWLFKSSSVTPTKRLTGLGPGYHFKGSSDDSLSFTIHLRPTPEPQNVSYQELRVGPICYQPMVGFNSPAVHPFILVFGSAADKYDATGSGALVPPCGVSANQTTKVMLIALAR